MNRFSPLEIPLKGINLIEASAGTGKTYSIAAIFLRLVLEGKPVDSILAVTFTRSATAELKNRLLEFLKKAKNILTERADKRTDPIITAITLQHSGSRGEALKRLERAIISFDKCSVFTIHGFCSKIVRENAFESASRFNLELSKDTGSSIKEAVIDFWRKYSGTADEHFLHEAASKKWFSIDELARLIKGRTLCEKPLIVPETDRKELSWERNQEIFKKNDDVEKEFCTDALILLDRLFDEARENIEKKRNMTGKMGFDDLLSILESALNRSDAFSKQLINIMEKKYSAILIDEFQDTDPVQYSIFTKLFGNSKNPVFYIGDPKQSIYSFRNADVFAYLKVSRNPDITKYSMDQNHRSSPMMTKGVNTLFSMRSKPFILEESEIGYVPVRHKDSEDLNDLKKNGEDSHGIEIRYLCAAKTDERHLTKSKRYPDRSKVKLPAFGSIAYSDMCSRIIELTDTSNGYSIDGEAVRPCDITVLVLRHQDASTVKSYFEKRGIPAVLTSDQSVFRSKEMTDLLVLMEAAANPFPKKIRGALLTLFFKLNLAEITDILSDSKKSEIYSELFAKIGRNWEENGFLSAFSTFINNEEVYLNLAKEGERTLTNIRHLLELIHNREFITRRSVDSLISWVKGKMTDDERSEDEQLRLESDDNAVSIMTVHKSKGLDFKIVFIPQFIKKMSRKKPWNFFYHDRSDNFRPVLSFDENDDEGVKAGRIETMSENMRLLYVAMTRAKYLTVIHWGSINSTGGTPLSKLLTGVESEDEFKVQTDDQLLERINETVEAGNGSIKLVTDLSFKGEVFKNELKEKTVQPARTLKKEISKEWMITSFSGLSFHAKGSFEFEDVELYKETAIEKTEPVESGGKRTILDFPAGASAGTALHAVFEEIDFKSRDNSDIIADVLERYGMRYSNSGDDMVPWVSECINSVLDFPHFSGRCLRDVKTEEMLTEMEFFFDIDKIKTAEINKLFNGKISIPEQNITGFIHGFIDLVFKLDGKYYIVDWKSNKLAHRAEDYTDAAVEAEMKRHNYIFQYMLYAVALDRYLTMNSDGYSYERDFGGVSYVFLRGPAFYFDRPEIKIFQKFREIMSGKR